MFKSIEEIVEANKVAGYHFFDLSTMNFFSSEIASQTVYGGRYFITSEQFIGSNNYRAPRMYTVRKANDDGDIDTVGKFNVIPTLREAVRVAKQVANEEDGDVGENTTILSS